MHIIVVSGSLCSRHCRCHVSLSASNLPAMSFSQGATGLKYLPSRTIGNLVYDTIIVESYIQCTVNGKYPYWLSSRQIMYSAKWECSSTLCKIKPLHIYPPLLKVELVPGLVFECCSSKWGLSGLLNCFGFHRGHNFVFGVEVSLHALHPCYRSTKSQFQVVFLHATLHSALNTSFVDMPRVWKFMFSIIYSLLFEFRTDVSKD